MIGQHDQRQQFLVGQVAILTGHCLLTGRYFEPCYGKSTSLRKDKYKRSHNVGNYKSKKKTTDYTNQSATNSSLLNVRAMNMLFEVSVKTHSHAGEQDTAQEIKKRFFSDTKRKELNEVSAFILQPS